jgi:hypothetical protein
MFFWFFFCFFESNIGHVAKVGVQDLGKERKLLFWGFLLNKF